MDASAPTSTVTTDNVFANEIIQTYQSKARRLEKSAKKAADELREAADQIEAVATRRTAFIDRDTGIVTTEAAIKNIVDNSRHKVHLTNVALYALQLGHRH
jgi:hypothetical protein